MKRRHYYITLALCVLLLSSSIYAMPSVSVINHFGTGTVDISLLQDNGTENTCVLSGDDVLLNPKLINNGANCYVRVKFIFRDTEYINEECLKGIGKEWVKADDGYWYCKKILAHGESIDIFNTLTIPEEMVNDSESNAFEIATVAEAVQSNNLAPDFNAEYPWGDIEILQQNKKGECDTVSAGAIDLNSFEIVYQGDSEEIISEKNDFFVNLPCLMPGDSHSDTIEIKNDGNKEISLFFKSEPLSKSTLNENMILEIMFNEMVIYKGDLKTEDLADGKILGSVKPGEKGSFKFTIKVPEQLDNEYSLLSADVRWIFSTEEIEPVDTGDEFNIILYIICAVFSLSIFIVMTYKRNKEGKAYEQS